MSFDLSEILPFLEDLNMGNLSHNTSVEFCPTTFDRNVLLRAMCTLYVFIFVVGLAANLLVVWVNVRAEHHRHRHETHLYILNLAVADLWVVATLPVWVASLWHGGHWPLGEAACKLTHLLFSVNLFASIFFLACMSLDRYLTVVHFGDAASSSSAYQRKRLVRRLVCVGVWLLALAASVPDAYFLRAVEHADITQCCPVYPEESQQEWMAAVQLSFVVLGFAVPFPVIAVSYALLASALAAPTSSSSSSSSSSPGDHERRLSRKVILIYIIVFLVCWAPYHLVLLLDALVLLGTLPATCAMDNALYVAMHLTQCLSLLHCCVNPVVYSFIHRHYRYDLMKAFIFKYSTRTGIARLMENSNGADMEYSAVENPSQL